MDHERDMEIKATALTRARARYERMPDSYDALCQLERAEKNFVRLASGEPLVRWMGPRPTSKDGR